MANDKKSILLKLTAGIAFLGLIAAGVPFIKSMNPDAKAIAALPRIDISEIKPGQFTIKYPNLPGWFGYYQKGVFIYRKYDGSINFWRVPVKNGKVGMPDMHWWQPMYFCENFGPNVKNGKVEEAKPITCHDDAFDSWKKVWTWDINGKSAQDPYYDMERVQGYFENNYFVIGRRS